MTTKFMRLSARSMVLALVTTLFFVSGVAQAQEAEKKPKVTKKKDDKKSKENKKDKKEKKAKKPSVHEVTTKPILITETLKASFVPEDITEIKYEPEEWKEILVKSALEPGTLVKKGDVIVEPDYEKIDEKLEEMDKEWDVAKLSRKLADLEYTYRKNHLHRDKEDREASKDYTEKNYEYFEKVMMAFQDKVSGLLSDYYALSVDIAKKELSQLEKMYADDDLTEETEELVMKRQAIMARSSELSLENFNATEKFRKEVRDAYYMRLRKRMVEDMNDRYVLEDEKRPYDEAKRELSYQKSLKSHAERQEKLMHTHEDRDLMKLVAPNSGMLFYGEFKDGSLSGARDVYKEGDKIRADSVVFTIVKLGRMHLKSTFSEKLVGDIKRGLKGVVTPTAYSDMRLPVEVTEFSILPKKGSSYSIKLSVKQDKKDARVIYPGMSGSIRLTLYRNPKALVVPSSMVFSEELDPDAKYVYVWENDKSVKRSVETGKTYKKDIEILKGLKVGDEILKKKPDEDKK